MTAIRRRDFLAGGAAAAGILALGPSFWRAALAAPATVGDGPYGPLQPPDANGLMLPPGFRSRELARGGLPVPGTGYTWHTASDGQATFAQPDGSWVLVSNSETLSLAGGGASALHFDAQGDVRSAYRICGGTSSNCAGGRTPWGTWLTCEEYAGGQVWECDPLGEDDAVMRPAMGTFNHEAVAVDPAQKRLYMTEDEGDGCFYRFTPDAYPDLTSGLLEVAAVNASNRVSWRAVPDPLAVLIPTRRQVPSATRFAGGEGIWFDSGFVYFTTKGDDSLWSYDTATRTLEKLYDPATSGNGAFLQGPDNLTVARSGDLFVCEDNGESEFDIVMVTPERVIAPFLRTSGADGEIHRDSEFAGVIFSPDGERMYFSSQRGHDRAGVVYEVTGPFRPAPVDPGRENPGREDPGEQPPVDPPVDEQPPTPLPPQERPPRVPNPRPGQPPRTPQPATVEDVDAPGLTIAASGRLPLATLRRTGLAVTADVGEAATLTVVLRTSALATTPGKRGSDPRPVEVVLARATVTVAAGRRQLRLKPAAKEAKRIEAALRAARRRGRPAQLRARLSVQAKDAAGNVRIATRAVTISAAAAVTRAGRR
ncbi:MAG TPA: alkaline phosphatase PhoX [Conexibacter sp.]|nr:alkaline phosphatase PhoX [Conexibacter sp.]